MIREIVTTKKLNAKKVSSREIPDEFLGKVLKLIPAEVVSIYIAAIGIIEVTESVNNTMMFWIIFVLCFIATPLYLWRLTHVKDTLQLVISTIAFVVWVFAVGNKFITETITGYQTAYGAIFLIFFTFFVGLLFPDT